MASLAQLFGSLRSLRGRVLVTFHALGDADAVASALALQELLSSVSRAQVSVRSVEGMTAHARHLLQQTGFPPLRDLDGLAYDAIVFVDVDTPALLGAWEERFAAFHGPRFVLDHHARTVGVLPADVSFIDGSAASCSELVYALFEHARARPSPRASALLLAGALADSARFKSASPRTFRLFVDLLPRSGLSYAQVLALAEPPRDFSERLAVLECQRNSRAYEVRRSKASNGVPAAGRAPGVGAPAPAAPALPWVVAVSTARAFENKCAAALVASGADYAFVGNEKTGRLSAARRSTLAGIGVNRVLEDAARVLEGRGGGHANVASATGKPDCVPAALLHCVEIVKRSA